MAFTDLRDADFEQSLGEVECALVDFHAGDHAECILMKAVFARLSREYPNISFFLVDAFDAPQTTETVFLEPVPHFAAYRRGEKLEGLSTREERGLRELIARSFGGAPTG